MKRALALLLAFSWSGILLAGVFALVHRDLKYFIFYFAFGLVAGFYTRKSRSLIIGTSMHMMNNMMAFFYILSRQP